MQGYLLLSVAADAGKMDEVDRLLSQGVDVNAFGDTCGAARPGVNAVLAYLANSSRTSDTCGMQPLTQ